MYTFLVEPTDSASRRRGSRREAEEKSRRTIALPPSAFLVLEAYRKAREIECKMLDVPLKDSDMVFSTLGKPLRPNTVSRAWVMLAAKVGLKVIRMHDARHTHASLMLKQGIHPKIVQERLGHSTIAITLDTYSPRCPRASRGRGQAV